MGLTSSLPIAEPPLEVDVVEEGRDREKNYEDHPWESFKPNKGLIERKKNFRTLEQRIRKEELGMGSRKLG